MRQGFESPQPPLREKVYRQIKSMIFSGQIEAGNPLSELEISRMINVGRTPIRESLLQLTGGEQRGGGLGGHRRVDATGRAIRPVRRWERRAGGTRRCR